MILFREIQLEDAQMILTWRTNPDVDRWMLSHVDDDLRKQKSWIRRMRYNERSYHWIAMSDGVDIAYVKFDDYNREKKNVSVGFYLGESRYSSLTINILHAFYVGLFKVLGIDSILAGVFEGNSILKIHEYSGYEYDSSRQPVVIKGEHAQLCLKYYILRKENFLHKHSCKNITILPMKLWAHRFDNSGLISPPDLAGA